MNVLRAVHFPPPISSLLRSLSEVGFFDSSLLIGSWVNGPQNTFFSFEKYWFSLILFGNHSEYTANIKIFLHRKS